MVEASCVYTGCPGKSYFVSLMHPPGRIRSIIFLERERRPFPLVTAHRARPKDGGALPRPIGSFDHVLFIHHPQRFDAIVVVPPFRVVRFDKRVVEHGVVEPITHNAVAFL